MNKVLVQLYIPVTGKKYDIRLPQTVSVHQATELIASFFTGLTGGAYIPGENPALCDMTSGAIYNVNSSVESLHLKNGTKLMLV